MRRLLPLAVLLLAACASTSDDPPAGFTRPLIELQQPGGMFFGSDASTVITIDVAVQNRANVSLTVRHIALSSVGMTDYTLVPTARTLNVVIPPGESRTMGVVVRAEAVTARSQTSEPLSVRAVVRMEANGHLFREVIMQRLAGARA